jgi:hypothetical protein
LMDSSVFETVSIELYRYANDCWPICFLWPVSHPPHSKLPVPYLNGSTWKLKS